VLHRQHGGASQHRAVHRLEHSLIARVCPLTAICTDWICRPLIRLDSWSQQEELRRLNHEIHFLNGKARAEAKPGYHARNGSSARSTIDHGPCSTMNRPRSLCLFATSSHTVPNHSPRLHEIECSEIFQAHVIANQFFDFCWVASWLIPKLHASL
jgi:hypothetical protein